MNCLPFFIFYLLITMMIKKGKMLMIAKYRVKNDNGDYQILHLETVSDAVLVNGETLTSKLLRIEEKLNNLNYETATSEEIDSIVQTSLASNEDMELIVNASLASKEDIESIFKGE